MAQILSSPLTRYHVAVVLTTHAEPGPSILRGIGKYTKHCPSWQLHTLPLGNYDDTIVRAAAQCDGIITQLLSHEMATMVHEARIPVVALHYRGDLPLVSVNNNNQRIADIAAEHLLAQGFRRFAFFGAAGKRFSVRRGEFFERAVSEQGYTCESLFAGQVNGEAYDWHTHDEKVCQWLRDLPKPIGILAANDVVGAELLLNAQHAGIRVPDDVAVVGVDNNEVLCQLTSPPLSSIDTAGERIGYEAAALLDKLFKGEPIAERRVMVEPGQLTVRQSSDVLAVSDPNVAEALQYIRQHTDEGVTVRDVLRQVAVARRTLELAFRKFLGRSIYDEIIDNRIRRMRRLLVETDMPIEDVTEACGFCSRTRTSMIFKKRTGYGPAAFRREFRKPK